MTDIDKSDIGQEFVRLAIAGLDVLELELNASSTVSLILLDKTHQASVANKYALQFVRILGCRVSIGGTSYLGMVSTHRAHKQSAYLAECLRGSPLVLAEMFYHFEIEVESDRGRGRVDVVAADFVFPVVQVLPRARAPERGLH